MRPPDSPGGGGPRPLGPYAPLREAGGWVAVSGQIGLTREGALIAGGIKEQTRRALENTAALLEAAGLDLSAVVKTTVFMTDLSEFEAVNEIYARFFKPPYPARSTVQVCALPRGARVEIESLARRSH